MKIGVDIRALASGTHSGVEEYTIEFLRALFAERPQDQFVLFCNAYRGTVTNLSWATSHPNVVVRYFRIPNKLLNLSLWLLRWPQLDKLIGGVDMFVMPNINFCAVSRRTKLVVTIHDLSFVHYRRTFSWKRRLWHWMVNPRQLANRAHAIVAVSQFTQRDLHATFRVPLRKIHVLHNAVASRYRRINRNSMDLVVVKEKYRLPFRFILFLGTIEPRKNIIGLVRAYEALRKEYGTEHNKVQLVIAGARGWKSREIIRTINKSPFRKDIRLFGFIPEEEKAIIYNLASVFVYPSFFEGFGFPPLEALACGVPTITSNMSSFPEVVGDCAIMIDPDRPEEITMAMHQVLTNKELAQYLQEHTDSCVARFSWKDTAQKFSAQILRDK